MHLQALCGSLSCASHTSCLRTPCFFPEGVLHVVSMTYCLAKIMHATFTDHMKMAPMDCSAKTKPCLHISSSSKLECTGHEPTSVNNAVNQMLCHEVECRNHAFVSVSRDIFMPVMVLYIGSQTVVQGATRLPISCATAAEALVKKAAAARAVESTAMNAVSSRSHSVFTLYITGRHETSGQSLQGALNLVDLAGRWVCCCPSCALLLHIATAAVAAQLQRGRGWLHNVPPAIAAAAVHSCCAGHTAVARCPCSRPLYTSMLCSDVHALPLATLQHALPCRLLHLHKMLPSAKWYFVTNLWEQTTK